MIRFTALGQAGAEHFDLADLRFGIGRAASNRITLTDPTVSAHHAEIAWEGHAYRVRDLGSSNGLWLSEGRVEQFTFSTKCDFLLGRLPCQIEVLDPLFLANTGESHLLAAAECRVGRAPDNDWVIPHPTISLHHARFCREQGMISVENLSRQVMRVAGLPVGLSPVAPGETVQCGDIVITLHLPVASGVPRVQFLPWNGQRGERGLVISGILGREEADALAAAIGALAPQGNAAIYLELSQCKQLHPRALELILETAGPAGRGVVIVNPSAAADRAFSLANAGKFLNSIRR